MSIHPNEVEFGKIRNFFWPIHNYELKKLIPMVALFFLIAFIYNLLHNMKTALIVVGSGVGAIIIPYLKIGLVLPMALFFTYLYTCLINKFNREQVFYIIFCTFLAYFTVFLFFLYPNRDSLRVDVLADWLQTHLPKSGSFVALVALVREWNLSLFYVVSELWSPVILSMLFWGFANEVTKVHEAKRFYAIFALAANLSGIFSGLLPQVIRKIPKLPIGIYSADNQWIFLQIAFVLFIGCVVLSIFYWLNSWVFHVEHKISVEMMRKQKSNISLLECFKYLVRSRYLLYIVMIVVAYNIVYNLSDVIWAHQIHKTYVTSYEVNSYMNKVTTCVGIVAVIFAFLISGNVIRYYGWTVTALITPIIWLLTGIGFFSGLVVEDFVVSILKTIIANPGNMVLFIGSLQICLGRACKYTVFDETKEIAFVPLPKDEQRKAKAIVDGLTSRIGKSSGSIIYICLSTVLGSIDASIPYVAVIVICSIIVWIVAIIGLGKMVNNTIDLEQPAGTEEKIILEPISSRTVITVVDK